MSAFAHGLLQYPHDVLVAHGLFHYLHVVVANDLIQSLRHVVTELTNVSRRTSLVTFGLEMHCCVYR